MMESTTSSRLSRALAEYDRASNRLGYAIATPSYGDGRLRVPVNGSPGGSVTAAAIDDDGGYVGGRGVALDPDDHIINAAYAAGRTLERCIQEHRFGRKEPVTHKFYGGEGECRITKDEARAMGHNLPESTPWLP